MRTQIRRSATWDRESKTISGLTESQYITQSPMPTCIQLHKQCKVYGCDILPLKSVLEILGEARKVPFYVSSVTQQENFGDYHDYQPPNYFKAQGWHYACMSAMEFSGHIFIDFTFTLISLWGKPQKRDRHFAQGRDEGCHDMHDASAASFSLSQETPHVLEADTPTPTSAIMSMYPSEGMFLRRL